MTIDQLRALEKLLPDSGTVEMVKGYNGDIKLLGTAEDFFLKLVKVKQLSCLLCAPVFVVCASVCCVRQCVITQKCPTWTGLVSFTGLLSLFVRSLCGFWKPASPIVNLSLI